MYEKKRLGRGMALALSKLKIPLYMNLILVLLLAVNLHVSASSYAQKVSVSGKQMELSTLLRELQKKSGLNIFYSQNLVKSQQRVDVDFQNLEATQILDVVLPQFDLDYKMLDKSIVLVRRPVAKNAVESVTSVPQELIFSGRVHIEGTPLEHVTVRERNATAQAVTDAQGAFSITLSKLPTVLSFSIIGFQTQEIEIEALDPISVEMQELVAEMDEVVVIGYGEVRKKDLTGSVVNLKMDEIKDVPVLSVDLAMQGRVPGADIMARTGEPGATTAIRLRGTRSITAPAEPLIVVDGVIGGIRHLADINTPDIASISVLKDASATATYGTRGSNGVIIITTKQGRKGRDNITLRSTLGLSQLPRKLEIMNAAEFAQYRNDFAYFSTSDG